MRNSSQGRGEEELLSGIGSPWVGMEIELRIHGYLVLTWWRHLYNVPWQWSCQGVVTEPLGEDKRVASNRGDHQRSMRWRSKSQRLGLEEILLREGKVRWVKTFHPLRMGIYTHPKYPCRNNSGWMFRYFLDVRTW